MIEPAITSYLFRQFEKDYGVIGVAYGRKEVKNKTSDEKSLSFFVQEKIPVSGNLDRLIDGRKIIPKKVELQGEEMPTDIITVSATDVGRTGVRSSGGIRRSGSRIFNGAAFGTFGCIVENKVGDKFVLSNSHIGLNKGTEMYFPSATTIGAHICYTTQSVGLVGDHDYFEFIDEPKTLIDVDAALIEIPSKYIDEFSQSVPYFGVIDDIFSPKKDNLENYDNSLKDLEVFSYSWKGKRRYGRINFTHYAYRNVGNNVAVANFLVQGDNSSVPGFSGDSGKIWITKISGRNYAVGLHFGVVQDHLGAPKFAMASEISSVLRYLDVSLYHE